MQDEDIVKLQTRMLIQHNITSKNIEIYTKTKLVQGKRGKRRTERINK